MALILSWQNWSDQSGAVLATDSAASTLPVANLSDPVIAKVWRTSGATSAYLQIDLGQARSVGFIMLAGATLDTTDTIRVRLGSTAGAGDLLDTGAVAANVTPEYGMWAYVLTAAISARYIQLDFVATSRGSLGYFDVGRLWVGTAFQPIYDAAFGLEDEWVDYSPVAVCERSGVSFPLTTYQKRRWMFSLDALSVTEGLDSMREMGRIAGVRNQVALIPAPSSTRLNKECVIGRMTKTTPVRRPDYGIYTKTFEVLEDK